MDIMRKRIAILGIAMILCLGGCQGARPQETSALEVTIPETSAAPTEAEEYVSDEDWDALVRAYRILERNFTNAEDILLSGQATGSDNPEEVVATARELLEYGKTCGKEDLLSSEADELLADMVDAADGMLSMIERSGGTVITEQEAGNTEAAAAEDDPGEAAQDGGEAPSR